MPHELTRYDSSPPNALTTTGRQAARRDRLLQRLEDQTRLRIADVQAHELVQTEKLRGIDNLAREAMVGTAFLSRWRDTLAAGDLLLADELNVFAAVARAGKAEIIAETISDFCREGR